MANELTIFRTGAVASTKFDTVDLPKERLDDGVGGGFARVGYKAKEWSIRYQGAVHTLKVRTADGDEVNSSFFDCVILRASKHPNKTFYMDAYTEENSARKPPDCWSSNGVRPDSGVPIMDHPSKGGRQSPTCVSCPWNVWGSKINRETGQATRGKACMDSKHVAVVPVGDIENVMYGGPMLLSIPPSSLKKLGPYQNMLEANHFSYTMVWTRIGFEPSEVAAYPMFKFDAMAALNDVQADQVIRMLNHPLIDRILEAEVVSTEAWDESAQEVHQSIKPPPPPVAAVPSKVTDVEPEEPAEKAPPAATAAPVVAGKPPATVTMPNGMVLTMEQLQALSPDQIRAMSGNGSAPAEAPAPAGPAKRQTKPRTPPVSPTPTDSAKVTGMSGNDLPTPVPMPVPAQAAKPAANGGADPASKLLQTIDEMT
jgi:hypothetical protein